MTMQINLDPGELPQMSEQLSEKVAQALASAMHKHTERLLAEAFAARPRTPPPRPSGVYWRPHDTAWSQPLYHNCRCVVVPLETDYIETEYTVGEATQITESLQ
ncbi:MAG: hypothetical protein E6R03_14665 [Hyphomicrobiaceae bacterium]|nr:MAG: hypothetical protein E6R03_14665 [Hyphomicrobiaceae bacterium]